MLGMIKRDLRKCMTYTIDGQITQSRRGNLSYPKIMTMKKNYLIKDHYLLQLENDTLREQLKQLKAEIAELKNKLNEKEMPKMQDRKTIDGLLHQ
jgi:regulator of replication initiation timing